MSKLPARHYRFECTIPAESLLAVIGTLEGVATDVKFEMIPLPELPEQPIIGKRIKTVRYRDGIRGKGVLGNDLVLYAILDGYNTPTTLSKRFGEKGFAPVSYSAAASKAHQMGYIVREENGTWSITDAGRARVGELRAAAQQQNSGKAATT